MSATCSPPAGCPANGFLRPEALARALAAGASALGVEFVTGTAVTGIDVVGGRVRGVPDRRRADPGRRRCQRGRRGGAPRRPLAGVDG